MGKWENAEGRVRKKKGMKLRRGNSRQVSKERERDEVEGDYK